MKHICILAFLVLTAGACEAMRHGGVSAGKAAEDNLPVLMANPTPAGLIDFALKVAGGFMAGAASAHTVHVAKRKRASTAKEPR